MDAERKKEFEYIFYPKAVAVIGASYNDGFSQSLMRTKMKDNLFLVNPKYKELSSKKCYDSILDITDEIDYAVIAVPAPLVPKVLTECIQKRVKVAHIFSAGFAETGIEERLKLEDEIKQLTKGKIRIIGPNCMGIHCSKSGLAFIPDASTEEGAIGVISQSGTVAEQFLTLGKIRNIKFSKVISYGNAIDLDCPDFLEYLADDPETKVIALYIEGTRDGKRLRTALGKIARKKPVFALKGGVTEHGSRAASSHTGSLAGSPKIWAALFQQTGVVQVSSFEELLDAVLALSCSPLPPGKGVSIITNSGGFSVIETDLCVKAGLEVPQFHEETTRELRKIVPIAGTSIGNPLDAWPIYYNMPGQSGTLADAIRIVINDRNIHSLVLHFDEISYLRRFLGDALENHLKQLVKLMISGCRYARDEMCKPVMVCVSLDAYSEDEEDRRYHLLVKKAFESERFPVYPTLNASIKALLNLYRYSKQNKEQYSHTK
ncbi:MAG: CoA-binding protein [candidate division KSB1 bacterium]|nr:CoA-binding protein [candidate division KSB1 bacterium]